MSMLATKTDMATAAARAFVRAVVDRDQTALAELLTDDVWYRSLLPRKIVEHHDRDSVVATFDDLFGRAPELLAERTYHHSSQGREFVGWRLRLRPDWEPEVWHLIEQVGHVRVVDGRIRRIDLVCTGFQPTDAPSEDATGTSRARHAAPAAASA